MPPANNAVSLPGAYQLKRIAVFKPLKPRQLKFISGLLRTSFMVERAAKVADVEWRSHYRWMQQPDYKQAVEYAKDILGDTLEGKMLADAIEGREVPIVYKGKVTGNIREVFSSERIALLKGLKPQYREGFSLNSVGPVALAISYPSSGNRAITPDNGLSKLGNDPEEATIINPIKP